LNFISHSASVVQLQFLFQVLLKGERSKGKVVLDVGSRLGAVLYAVSFFFSLPLFFFAAALLLLLLLLLDVGGRSMY
jgi:hypothetical protein